MSDSFLSLDKQINELEENLRLIIERKSEFPEQEKIPLDLIKNERRIEAQLTELRARRQRLVAIPCPYRGLEPFELEHASNFFGRKAMIQKVLDKLRETNFVAVVGPSGCGKSSLVRAGVLDVLKKEARSSQSGNWEFKIFRPSEDPMREMARVLVDLLDPAMTPTNRLTETRKLADGLFAGIHVAVGYPQLLAPDQAVTGAERFGVLIADVLANIHTQNPDLHRLVLVLDQFEEVFTLCRDNTLCRAFLAILLTASRTPWITVILTLRADFYGRVLAEPQLAERVDAGLVNVLPMSTTERRLSIEQPALAVGCMFESGLVDRILDALEAAPGDLPLLEFALTELWKKQTSTGELTHAAYEEIGEISGAIAQHASAVFGNLTKQQKEQAQQLFKRLVHIDQSMEETENLLARATNWRIRLKEWDSDAQTLVKEVLAVQRLVITGRNQTTGDETVELVHETLIQYWPLLRSWLTEDPVSLRTHQALIEAVQLWHHNSHGSDLVYRGERLEKALSWHRAHPTQLNRLETEFLQKSVSVRTQQRVLYGSSAVVAIIALCIIVWLSMFREPTLPTTMPANHFNIAAVPFRVSNNSSADNDTLSSLERDADRLAQQMTELLLEDTAYLRKSAFQEELTIWGPDQFSIALPSPDIIQQKMREANVNILVTGELQQSKGRYWSVQPKFYVADTLLKQRASEMLGSNALGQSIDYLPGNSASLSTVRDKLRSRMRILNRFIVGISYFDQFTAEGYTKAREFLCDERLNDKQADDNSGYDILLMFCGNATLLLAWSHNTEPDQYKHLLQESIKVLEAGLEYNPNNVRLLTSLGTALVRIGSPSSPSCSDGDREALSRADTILRRAITQFTFELNAPYGTVMEAHNALGDLHIWLGVCYKPEQFNEEWIIAKRHYDSTIAVRQNATGRLDILDQPAATAHMQLGYISMVFYWSPASQQSEEDHEQIRLDAIQHYSTAIELLLGIGDEVTLKYATQNIPYLLSLYCKGGEPEKANQALNKFVEQLPNSHEVRGQILESFGEMQPEIRKDCEL